MGMKRKTYLAVQERQEPNRKEIKEQKRAKKVKYTMVRLAEKNRGRTKNTPYIERGREAEQAVKALERQWCEDSSNSTGSNGDCTL